VLGKEVYLNKKLMKVEESNLPRISAVRVNDCKNGIKIHPLSYSFLIYSDE
jgi:hypothetical protein